MPRKQKVRTIVSAPAKGSRLTGIDRETFAARLARGYTNGKPIRALATENKRSYGNVHRLLNEAGVNLRPRGGKRTSAH